MMEKYEGKRQLGEGVTPRYTARKEVPVNPPLLAYFLKCSSLGKVLWELGAASSRGVWPQKH